MWQVTPEAQAQIQIIYSKENITSPTFLCSCHVAEPVCAFSSFASAFFVFVFLLFCFNLNANPSVLSHQTVSHVT